MSDEIIGAYDVLASPGNARTELDELELGKLVALVLDMENNVYGAAGMLLAYEE